MLSINTRTPQLEEAPVDGNFLDKTIQITKESFIDGYQNNKKLQAIVLTNRPSIDAFFRDPNICESTGADIPQFNDACFPTYNANIISDTNLIAAAGPKSYFSVAKFFYNLAFNEKLPAPVQEIIAIGYVMNGGPLNYADHFDFFDYPTASGKKATKYVPSAKNPAFEIKADYVEVKGTLQTSLAGHRRCFEEQPVQSTIKVTCPSQKDVKEVELNVTFHTLRDNESFDLSKASNETKEIFWQHHLKSLKGPVLIHCAAGVGRTGHVILILELLRNFKDVFSNTTPTQAAAKIAEIIDRIRLTRPGLIRVNEQLEMAIRNAVILRNYALAKGYALDTPQNLVLKATPPTLDWKSLIPSLQKPAQPAATPLDAKTDAVPFTASVTDMSTTQKTPDTLSSFTSDAESQKPSIFRRTSLTEKPNAVEPRVEQTHSTASKMNVL